MKNYLNTSMRIADLFGRRPETSLAEVFYTIFHKSYLGYIFVIIFLLAVLDTFNLRSILPIWAPFVYWFFFVWFQIFLYVLFLSITPYLQQKFTRLIVVFPVISVIGVFINTIVIVKIYFALTGQPFEIYAVIKQFFIINVITSLLIELLFFRFVRPITLKQFLQSHTLMSRNILIGKVDFKSDEILILQSQDHYVVVTTDKDRKLVRARLSDVLKQLSNEEGISPHRSYWVAQKAVASVFLTKEKSEIRTHSNHIIPIAGAKKNEVQVWAKNNNIETSAS